MMDLMKIKKDFKKYKKLSINSVIYRNYYHKKIDEHLVFVESREGKDFTGNMLRIVEELSTGKYGNFKIFVFAKENVISRIEDLKKNYNLKIDQISSKETTVLKTLEIAKYIISDSGMPNKFVKRPEQIFIDTWHGTPLKTMGVYNEAEEHRCATIQQVFFAADYLLFPNDYMKEKMLSAYMMEKIYPGKILLEGYPRNSIFFNENAGENLKNKLGYSDKQLFAYMPTFKGILSDRKDEKQKDEIINYLHQIDSRLNDDQILFVKLHVFNQEKINFNEFQHVEPFPKGYEIYDVLNMTDCLITDYSSVLFDYANTRRKIIIFNYDEEEYMMDRGTFFSLSELPFPKVQNVNDLIAELNSAKNYDDKQFIEKFCTYDCEDAVERVCRHIFNNENICREEKIKNEKKNVLLFGGALQNNGMTSSLLNLLTNADREKYNFFICYRSWNKTIKNDHREIFKKIPEGVEFLPLRSKIEPTLFENFKLNRFTRQSKGELSKTLIKLFTREFNRSFNGFIFDAVIHFNGYGVEEILLFSTLKSKKLIWVHNDMVKELKLKENQNLAVLKWAYNKYDIVSIVSPDLLKPTVEISGRKDNIKLVHNINDYKKIIEKSNDKIEISNQTEVITDNPDGIQGVLNSPGKKFITIGRFSEEKGHERLIKSFDKFCDDFPDTQLIIIGGYGKFFNEAINMMRILKHGSNITLIKNIPNPMPILSQCDLFIVSSFYEGWPMVIMEADALNIPIIATDITGTQWMKNYDSYIIDNSDEGILQGMYDFMEGKVTPSLNIDYEEYNQKAVKEFLDIL